MFIIIINQLARVIEQAVIIPNNDTELPKQTVQTCIRLHQREILSGFAAFTILRTSGRKERTVVNI